MGHKAIGDNAFADCTELKTVHLGARSIGAHVFDGCTALEEYYVSDELQSIGRAAFRGCAALESVFLPEEYFTEENWREKLSVGEENEAFFGAFLHIGGYHRGIKTEQKAPTRTEAGLTAGCVCEVCGKVLVEQVEIPRLGEECAFGEDLHWRLEEGGVLRISGEGEIPNCRLESIEAGYDEDHYGYFYLGDAPWSRFPELIRTVIIEEGVTSIGASAFEHCEKITKVTLPDGLTTIGEDAFAYSKLTDIRIPRSVKKIYTCAFTVSPKYLGTIQYILYPGTEEEWERVILAEGSGLEQAAVQFNSDVNPFVDVKPSHPFAEAISWAVERKITAGLTATRFGVDDPCTRGQVVTFLWRAAGQPEPKSTVNPFKDVKSGSPFYKAILWAAEQNITAGKTATVFGIDDTCTRGQVVTFLYRFAGQPKITKANTFKDVSKISAFSNAISWAVEQGITAGTNKEKNLFSPDAACTRGQVVTFLYRYMG